MIYARKITRKKEVRTLTTTLISADSTTNPALLTWLFEQIKIIPDDRFPFLPTRFPPAHTAFAVADTFHNNALLLHQLTMIPLFYNRSFIKYQNTIRELRRKQSVRNKQNRPLRRCQRLHDIPVDFPFRQRVQRARRFIQNYERIPVRNNPRQHQLLAFPTDSTSPSSANSRKSTDPGF